MMEFFLLVQYAHSVYNTEKLAGTVKYLRRSEALIISLSSVSRISTHSCAGSPYTGLLGLVGWYDA